jgi:hypothetical protein
MHDNVGICLMSFYSLLSFSVLIDMISTFIYKLPVILYIFIVDMYMTWKSIENVTIKTTI